MTSKDKLFFRITGGPSKWDFAVSLFEGSGASRSRKPIEFHLQGTTKVLWVTIESVHREDGSGESWNFDGTTVSNRERSIEVEGYFSTKTRTGNLRFKVPFHHVLKDGEMVKVVLPEHEHMVEERADFFRS